MTSALKYRADIDGLRAVAVLSVLLFHLGVPGVPAGFTGVDIFFVISGYLIVGILARDLAADRFSLWRFYRRRALRILPSLVLVLAVTAVFALPVLLPSEMRSLGASITATLGFVSNLYFWYELDYFTADAKENPLLHTWSLGVEEQFYIIVPLILWGLHRYARRWLVPLMAASVLISLGLSLWSLESMPRATFYLLPTRYWEMGAGAMLALIQHRIALSGSAAQALSGIGAALVAWGLFGLTDDLPFPGANALFPVLGATCLIAAGPGALIGRALSWRPMVWIGTISYSLYLWHWPVIVLYKLRTDPVLSPGEMLALAALSIVLAALSTTLWERRFRHIAPAAVSDRRVVIGSALAILAGIAAAQGIRSTPETLRAYPAEVVGLDNYAIYFDDPAFRARWRYDVCHLDGHSGGFRAFDQDLCLTGAGDRAILLIGDSHAAHLWYALDAALAPGTGGTLLQATSTDCRPLVGNSTGTFCGKLSNFILTDWIPANSPDTVIISANWRDAEMPGLAETIAQIRASGVREVIVLGYTVGYASELPKILARNILGGIDRTQAYLRPDQWDRDALLRATTESAGGRFIDLLEVFCPDRLCQTRTGPADVPVLFDSNHYTAEGAALMAQRIVGDI